MASTAAVMVTKDVPFPPVAVGGAMVHVVAPNEDETLQVRDTSELKLPTGATVRFVVMSFPLGIATTGLATVIVKSAVAADTVTGIWSVWASVPLVAVMVMEPVGAEAEALTVSALVTGAVGLAVTDAGFREQVSPVVPVQDKLIAPEKLKVEVSVSVSVLVPPAATVSEELPAAKRKSG